MTCASSINDDDFDQPVTARTDKKIDFIDLVDQARPGRSSARRDCLCVHECQRRGAEVR